MPAATIVVSNSLRGLHVATKQLVRQGRFADTGGSDQNDRAIVLEIPLQNLEAIACTRPDGVNWNVSRKSFGLTNQSDDVIAEIRFVHHDHRKGATLLHQRKIAVYPRHIEVTALRGHDEDDIDIGSKQLRFRLS